MVAAAALAIPAAEKGARALFELAQTPVIGWQTTETFSRGKKAVVRQTSFSLRMWEVAAAGIVGLLFLRPVLVPGGASSVVERPGWIAEDSIAWGILKGIVG